MWTAVAAFNPTFRKQLRYEIVAKRPYPKKWFDAECKHINIITNKLCVYIIKKKRTKIDMIFFLDVKKTNDTANMQSENITLILLNLYKN